MEDFCYAGGLPAVMKEILPLLHGGRVTANGRTWARTSPTAQNWNPQVIKTVAEPFKAKAGIAVLRATSRRAARSSSPAPPRPR
jgi:dihydroxy-acid dehydratase